MPKATDTQAADPRQGGREVQRQPSYPDQERDGRAREEQPGQRPPHRAGKRVRPECQPSPATKNSL